MHNLHFWRALLGTFAVGFGIVSLAYFPIASNAGLMFSEPIFFLPLAAIFLREKVGAGRVLCSLLGFAGVVIILHEDMNVLGIACLFPLLSAFLFAVICVIAKKMVYDEHLLTLLFYFGVGTTIFALVPAMFVWKAVSLWQIVMMIILGINGNLVQVCMFKAYAISDAAPLASIRYFELVLANLVGVLILNQALNVSVIIGSIIIVSCTILSTVIERRNNRPARHIRTADPFTLNFAPAKTKYKNLLP